MNENNEKLEEYLLSPSNENNNNMSNIKSYKSEDQDHDNQEDFEIVKLVQESEKLTSMTTLSPSALFEEINNTFKTNETPNENPIELFETSLNKDRVSTLIFPDSYNNKIFITGCYDGSIKIWDIETHHVSKRLKIHNGEILCLLHLKGFNSYNNNIASGGKDCIVRISNMNTGKCYNMLAEHTGPVNAIIHILDKFSYYCLVTASSDKNIKFWNLQHQSGYPKCFRTLHGHMDAVTCLINLNKVNFVSGGEDRTVRIWNNYTGECIKVLKIQNASVSSLTSYIKKIDNEYFELIVSGSSDGALRNWKKDEKAPLSSIETGKFRLDGVIKIEARDKDEKQIRIISCNMYSVRVWDIDTQKMLFEANVNDDITCMNYNEKYGRIYIGFANGKVKWYNFY